MVQIDKTDKLYSYLTNLGVDEIDKEYVELAQNGRYNINDIRQYYRQDFIPSSTEEVKEDEIEKVLDYYIDLKSIKHLNVSQIKKLLEEYKQTKQAKLKDMIINSQLKDILFLCLNYTTFHKKLDIQDLVQIANLGLLEAIEKYMPESRLEFKDYVIYYVRKNIKEFEEKN